MFLRKFELAWAWDYHPWSPIMGHTQPDVLSLQGCWQWHIWYTRCWCHLYQRVWKLRSIAFGDLYIIFTVISSLVMLYIFKISNTSKVIHKISLKGITWDNLLLYKVTASIFNKGRQRETLGDHDFIVQIYILIHHLKILRSECAIYKTNQTSAVDDKTWWLQNKQKTWDCTPTVEFISQTRRPPAVYRDDFITIFSCHNTSTSLGYHFMLHMKATESAVSK